MIWVERTDVRRGLPYPHGALFRVLRVYRVGFVPSKAVYMRDCEEGGKGMWGRAEEGNHC